jgi:hypothetical protein
MAMMNKKRDWHENLKLRERDYAVVIDSLPSFRTAHVDDYVHRLGKLWEHLGFLLEFSAQHAFVRHRFLRDRMKMKALDALAKRIVPVPSSQVCIAYGDRSNQAGIKGHPSTPVKGFARALQKRTTVVPMDETRPASCVRCATILWRRRVCLPPTTMASSSCGRTEMSCAVPTVLQGQLLEPRRQRRPEHPRTARCHSMPLAYHCPKPTAAASACVRLALGMGGRLSASSCRRSFCVASTCRSAPETCRRDPDMHLSRCAV